ncbi:MAG: RagB/SusD family nutrient uptake outer membrane protein [Butyricimonas faecihominis]
METIFSMGGHAITHNTVNQYKSFQVSREMYDTYDITDLRKSVFFWTYNDFVGYAKIAESSSFANDDPAADYYYNYTLAYEGRKIEVSDNFLFRNAEAYLNGAEAAAYLGDEATALDLLEQLRVKRFKNESYATLQKSGEELVTEIQEERRRELCLEGHRWFDLRRYMVCEKYPYSKEIEKVYYVYKDDSSDEKIEKRVYKLEKNDPAYVLPIPHEVLEFHTGMQNNPHPVRSYRIESLN